MKELKEKAAEIGVILNDDQIAQFEEYYELLIEWNSVMNLTAIIEKEEVINKHFIDSLLLAKYKNFNEDLKIIDVGTGAGFPGIPLKIAFPNLSVTLMDSLNKRIKFLDAVIQKLSLKGIETVHSRAEDGGRMDYYREQFDVAVSRAVAGLSSLSEFCMPFVKPEGYFIAYKSGALDEEMKSGKKAIRMLGGRIENIFTTTLPGTDIERKFLFVKKEENISSEYPRKAGMAVKKPLGEK